MGRSFTSGHIHNREGLTKAGFKKAFIDMIKNKGYTTSDEDNASLSYTLVFSKDRKWVTVLSEDEQDTKNSAAEIAKLLRTTVVNVELVDSDFAELSLFDTTGTHIDTLTLGESYLGDDAPTGSPECWQPLLSDGCTWKQVTAIQNNSYVFAEDALSDFAPLIGMDIDNILLDSESAADDKNTIALHFKKAKEKKLTLNSAFVKYFGDLLIPYGFVKQTINKRPYFIRIINNEILQTVTYRQVSASKVGYKTFEIYYGIMSLYRKHIDLTVSPECMLRNMHHLQSTDSSEISEDLQKRAVEYNVNFWQRERVFSLSYEFPRVYFYFNPGFLAGMEIARDIAEQGLLPRFQRTTTLENFIDYFYENNELYKISFYKINEENREFHDAECFDLSPAHDNSEAFALIKANYRKDTTVYTEKELANNVAMITGENEHMRMGLGGAKDVDDYKARFRSRADRETSMRDLILDTPRLKERALEYAEKIRQQNIDLLRAYGLKL